MGENMKPKLRFSAARIREIASRYENSINEDELVGLRPEVQARGYLSKEELQKIAYWKAPRSSGHVGRNSRDYVQEITAFALNARDERVRIEVLALLDGVSWPTASVILHFFHSDSYPIIDVRALWSVNLDVPSQYSFKLWWCYTDFCRDLAKKTEVDMRTLDRALWQYSKENK
jgi:hypothetical protein